MEIRDGKFLIDSGDKATQRALYMAINDNIYKNMDGFKVNLYDEDHKWRKLESSTEEKRLIVDKLILNNDLPKQEELIHTATDRILYAHRNLKAAMFLTSGPFFFALFLFKYTIKFSVLYFLYKKKKDEDGKGKEKHDAHPNMQ